MSICKPYHHEVIVGDELMGEGAPAAIRTITQTVNVMYIMQCSPADGQAILAEPASVPDITAVGVKSWTGDGLDIHITHREATKEHAIQELLRMLGISKTEVVGVGDANNDTHLFKAVGHKVAMGNATDLLKSQADEICDIVDNDGLASYIHSLLRGESLSF